MATWIHLQTPSSRHAIQLAEGVDLDEAIARLQTAYGFPEDWPGAAGWDCSIHGDEPHPTYWDRLFQVRQDRNATRGQLDQAEQQIAALTAEAAEMHRRYADLATEHAGCTRQED